MTSALAVIRDEVYGLRTAFESVVCDNSIAFEREARFAMQLMEGNDFLAEIAVKNKPSLRAAITNIAAIGISLNPANKQAYLVPRDGKVCLDISYMGLLDLATSSGSILWGQAELVYSGDLFKRRGYDQPPLHEFEEFSTKRGEIVGAYVVVKLPCGDFLTTTMTADEINAIRDRSSAWKAWVEKKKRCPWLTDWSEMAKKTVIKRASKTWPKSDRLALAMHTLNTESGEGLADIAANGGSTSPAGESTPAFQALLDSARAVAMKGEAALREHWEKHLTEDQRLSLKPELRSLRACATKADNDRTIDADAGAHQ